MLSAERRKRKCSSQKSKKMLKSLSANRRGLAQFAQSSEQIVPDPFLGGFRIGSKRFHPETNDGGRAACISVSMYRCIDACLPATHWTGL
jgi:hypothetical protein